MRLIDVTINGKILGVRKKLLAQQGIQRRSIIHLPVQLRPSTSYLMIVGLILLFIGITGCRLNSNATSPTVESTSLLPASLAEAIPTTPQDPELMVKALQGVFEKWALAGHLENSPEVLAAFYNLLILSDLEPVATMQTWLSEAQAQADGQETTDFAALEANLATDFQPLTLEESFFNLWQHAYENPNSATDAGVRLALIVAVGDENLQREIVRAWRQLIE